MVAHEVADPGALGLGVAEEDAAVQLPLPLLATPLPTLLMFR